MGCMIFVVLGASCNIPHQLYAITYIKISFNMYFIDGIGKIQVNTDTGNFDDYEVLEVG